ncbi:hypothetical protein EV10_0928 [Prochlorococcus marinus str. SS51]|nr:hypothetical protein EV08_1708 [Prochlorococcus marinus str. SS2]KGG22736.1 hypothetical protein EV09_1475 [Prochlorococcus marinus str. SS35]KGG32612.1 hypothetical protein EV10_0928 [Prochlorococcus marinus str. SS51]
MQVVLPEELCAQLTFLAKKESRTVSNMAKVLIQEGVDSLITEYLSKSEESTNTSHTESFRSSLETQQSRRLRGAPRRIKLTKP